LDGRLRWLGWICAAEVGHLVLERLLAKLKCFYSGIMIHVMHFCHREIAQGIGYPNRQPVRTISYE
jgi:hypothetical protein